MGDVPIQFLDDVIEYIDDNLIEGLSNNQRAFLGCRVRPFEQSMIKIECLSFIKENSDNDLVRVNSHLTNGEIAIRFHCADVDSWDSWDELLVSYWLRLNVGGLKPPYVVKWESSGMGVLKTDEFYDNSSEYIEKRVPAKQALQPGIERLLHEYLPEVENRFESKEVLPDKIRAMYEDDLDVIAPLI